MNGIVGLGKLRDPVLLAGFVVHRRAGRIGSRAVANLVGSWKGELVARLASEDFTDFTVDRPESRYSIDDQRTLKWPDTLVYLAKPEGASRDFLLVVGFEPSIHWESFVRAIVEYAHAAGVRTLVGIRGFMASVPHTRPTPVRITASDGELRDGFGKQARNSRYEGPTDVLGVLAAAGQARGWQVVDLSVLQPSYYPRMRNATATISIVTALDRAFGTSTPTDALEAEASKQLAVLEENAPPGDEFRSTIREWEQSYDEARFNSEFLNAPVTSELPSGEDMVNEIERLLRRERRDDIP